MSDDRPPDRAGPPPDDDDVTVPGDHELVARLRAGVEEHDDDEDDVTVGADHDVIAELRAAAASDAPTMPMQAVLPAPGPDAPTVPTPTVPPTFGAPGGAPATGPGAGWATAEAMSISEPRHIAEILRIDMSSFRSSGSLSRINIRLGAGSCTE